jgi:hypothetical protein
MANPPNQPFLDLLVDMLAKTVPAGMLSGQSALAVARTLLEAWQPADPMEAAMAARAVAAFLAAMDGFARAAKPGLDDAGAVRLRSNAIAAGRQFDAILRTIRRQRQPQPAKPPLSPAKPRPTQTAAPSIATCLDAVVRPMRPPSLRDSTALIGAGPIIPVPG